MKLLLFISFAIVAVCGYSQENKVIPPNVKNQKQLLKSYIPKYLAALPKTISKCGAYFLKGSDYHFLIANAGPEVFSKIFKYNQHKKLPSTGNQFSFDNGSITTVCERTYGYCHGYTAGLALWNRMAFFDELNVSKQNIPELHSDKWHKFYFSIIDKIMKKREPIIIPGFKNLYEFSASTPQITNYLKEHLAIMWAQRNVNFTGLFKVMRSVYNRFDPQEGLELHRNLSHKINNLKYNPIVYIANDISTAEHWYSLPKVPGIHVMQAYKITPIDEKGDYTIYFWDIYSPHDANKAISTYKVSTKNKSKKGRVQARVLSASQTSSAPSDTYAYIFADIEQVPFDDIPVGEDAVKMLRFLDKHPEFHKHLELEYKERLANPPIPYKPPFQGIVEEIPPVILKDGSHWRWQREHLNHLGQIHITQNLNENLPKEVYEVLNKFYPDINELETIDPKKLQVPLDTTYSFSNTGDTKIHKWDISWVDYDGYIQLPQNYQEFLPNELVELLHSSVLKWDSTKKIKTNYLEPTTRSAYVNSIQDEITIPMDLIDEHGNFFIPYGYKALVSKSLKKHLHQLQLWPFKSKIPLKTILKPVVLIGKTEEQVFTIPASYIKDDAISLPDNFVDTLPTWVKQILCGYNPNTMCPEVISIDGDRAILNTRIPIAQLPDSLEEVLFSVPLTWGPELIKDPLSMAYSDHFKIPDSEIEFVPQHIRDYLVGVNGIWPPIRNLFAQDQYSLVLNDGSKYTFPQTWLRSAFEMRSASDFSHLMFLNIPKGELKNLPKKILDLYLSTPPFKVVEDKPLNITTLQFAPTWKESQGGMIPLHFPRNWIDKDGNIKVPSQKKINLVFSEEEILIIKKTYDSFAPGVTLIFDPFQ